MYLMYTFISGFNITIFSCTWVLAPLHVVSPGFHIHILSNSVEIPFSCYETLPVLFVYEHVDRSWGLLGHAAAIHWKQLNRDLFGNLIHCCHNFVYMSELGTSILGMRCGCWCLMALK